MKIKLLFAITFLLVSFLSIAQEIEKTAECSKYDTVEPTSPLSEKPCLDKALPCSYYQNRFYLKK